MKYAHYNKDTQELEGFYDSEIHKEIPTPSIKMKEEDWEEAIEVNANYVDVENKKVIYKEPVLGFSKLKEQIIEKLKENTKYEEDVIVGDNTFKGGYDSAQKLDAKRRLAIESNLTEVTYINADDEPVILNLDEAKTVCLAVANAYETKFFNYKKIKKQILNAKTVEELEAINV